ncbi:hypothetical protein ACI8AV_14620 [Geodermatophilus sp. SYSU D00804]
MLDELVDVHGRPLRIGEQLGKGGEGTVFRLANRRDIAIKVYGSPLAGDRARKIELLAASAGPDVQTFTAWPIGLVRDRAGRARGLLLPVVEQAKDVHNLYTPGSRRKAFPDADWRFLVHVAANLARAFAAVHAKGLVIGDVNHGSVLVARNGTVRLIDVDSFQVPVPGASPLLCTVGVSLFTPPELHGVSFESLVRTSHHDGFGLAVLLFQLLLLGRHPYAGVYAGSGDMPIEKAIVEHRFAYGSAAKSRKMAPPPNAVGLNILPDYVAQYFEWAFSARAPRRGRPEAAQWVRALDRLGQELVRCGRNPTHQYARSLQQCPWCQFERKTKVTPFGSPPAGSGASQAGNEYAGLMAAIAAVQVPVPVSVAQAPNVNASRSAEAASRVRFPTVLLFTFGALAIPGGLVLMPAGLVLVIIGVVLLVVGHNSHQAKKTPWIEAYRMAKSDFDAASGAFVTANRFPSYVRAQEEVQRAARAWDELPRWRALQSRELEQGKREEQLRRFLDAKSIRGARIQGIGPSRAATLASFGITTAADVEYARIRQVPSFGDVMAGRLMGWRRNVERAFVYDPSRAVSRDAVERLEREFDERRRRALEAIRRSARALSDAAQSDQRAAKDAARRYGEASGRLRQAEADVKAATGGLPS